MRYQSLDVLVFSSNDAEHWIDFGAAMTSYLGCRSCISQKTHANASFPSSKPENISRETICSYVQVQPGEPRFSTGAKITFPTVRPMRNVVRRELRMVFSGRSNLDRLSLTNAY